MIDHTIRILKRIFGEIERYKKKEISEKKLMRSLEDHIGAIEELYVRNILGNFIIKIEESLYLYHSRQLMCQTLFSQDAYQFLCFLHKSLI